MWISRTTGGEVHPHVRTGHFGGWEQELDWRVVPCVPLLLGPLLYAVIVSYTGTLALCTFDEYQFSLLLQRKQKKIKRKCGLPGSVCVSFFLFLSLLLIIAACRNERVNVETKPNGTRRTKFWHRVGEWREWINSFTLEQTINRRFTEGVEGY